MNLQAVEADLRRAVGGRKVVEDHMAPALVERLGVTLECDTLVPRAGEALPAGWHTIVCLQAAPNASPGDDGLARQYHLISGLALQRRAVCAARLARPQ